MTDAVAPNEWQLETLGKPRISLRPIVGQHVDRIFDGLGKLAAVKMAGPARSPRRILTGGEAVPRLPRKAEVINPCSQNANGNAKQRCLLREQPFVFRRRPSRRRP